MKTIRFFIRTNERYVDVAGCSVVLTEVGACTTNASVLDESGAVIGQALNIDGWIFVDQVVSERVVQVEE